MSSSNIGMPQYNFDPNLTAVVPVEELAAAAWPEWVNEAQDPCETTVRQKIRALAEKYLQEGGPIPDFSTLPPGNLPSFLYGFPARRTPDPTPSISAMTAFFTHLQTSTAVAASAREIDEEKENPPSPTRWEELPARAAAPSSSSASAAATPTKPEALYDLGIVMRNAGKFDDAMLHFQQAAGQGHFESQLELILSYGFGENGQPRNSALAIEHTEFLDQRIPYYLGYLHSSQFMQTLQCAVLMPEELLDLNLANDFYSLAMHLEKKDLRRAIWLMEKAKANFEKSSPVSLGISLQKLGDFHVQIGSLDTAADYWVKAIRAGFIYQRSYIHTLMDHHSYDNALKVLKAAEQCLDEQGLRSEELEALREQCLSFVQQQPQ